MAAKPDRHAWMVFDLSVDVAVWIKYGRDTALL